MPNFVHFTPEQLNLSSGTPLGSGAISNVLHTTLAPPLSIPVAVKIYSKILLLQLCKAESVMNEKQALLRLSSHPYIARLYGTAQSEDELYAVMELLPNGDLLQHIRRTTVKRVRDYSLAQVRPTGPPTGGGERETTKRCDFTLLTDEAPAASPSLGSERSLGVNPASSKTLRCLDFHDIQLITAQLILGLSHVFNNELVLRDLKPENVVFDSKWRACLIDFDTVDLEGHLAKPHTNHGVALPEKRSSVASSASKNDSGGPAMRPPRRSIKVSEIQAMRKRTANFCGTAQYISPEMVAECRWSFSSDLWALGTIVYEMLYGAHMFDGVTSFEVMGKVIKGAVGSANGQAALPFPFIDFEESSDRASWGEEGAPLNPFARVKDFILRLVDIDPYKRLGVNPETHEFDLLALKGHALFFDFDWSVVEDQIQSFKQRTFLTSNEGVDANGTTIRAVLDLDASPSLQSLYHEVPYNDQQYADYVYNATSEANPFERYLQCLDLTSKIVEDPKSGADKIIHCKNSEMEYNSTSNTTTLSKNTEAAGGSNKLPFDCTPGREIVDSSNVVKQTSRFEGSSAGSQRSCSIDTDENSIEIIDDVGMRFHTLALDPDFR